MDHNARFLQAIGYVKAGEYENARALYKVAGALQSDLRVIERRIEQHMAKDANRSDK